jgi:hypothetical protein
MQNVQFDVCPKGQLAGMNVEMGKALGRPINPESKRQERLATAPGKKTGRPVNPKSKRQQRLAELAERAEANGGQVPRGRKPNPNSKRQQAIAAKVELEALKAKVAELGLEL